MHCWAEYQKNQGEKLGVSLIVCGSCMINCRPIVVVSAETLRNMRA
jgi:hypothetical protein